MRSSRFTLVIALLSSSVVAAETKISEPAEQLGWQMAIHSRTFKEFTLVRAMQKTAALRVGYFSLAQSVPLAGGTNMPLVNLSSDQIEELRGQLKTAGLKLVNVYLPLPPREDKSRLAFECAKKLGVDIIVSEPEPDSLDMLERLCKEYNIKVAIHNHPKPSRYWNPERLATLLKGRSSLLGACPDTGHWIRSGLDPVESLRKLEGRILCLHFKDLAEKSPKTYDVPWGTGIGNAKGQMLELKRQGFRGAFCVEYEHNWKNSEPEIAQCVKFFDEICRSLAGDSANAAGRRD